MFEKIEEKVHEIRKQPEHIRLRWVWGSVIVVMVFVIIVWMMSMRVNFLNTDSATQTRESISDFQDQFNDVTESLSDDEPVSIDDLIESGAIEQ